jgi:hypothetical protein
MKTIGFILAGVFGSALTVWADDIDLSLPVGSQKNPVANLALYYDFNNDSDSGIVDVSGGGASGTLQQGQAAAPPTHVPGVDLPGTSGYGKGLYFANPTFSDATPQSYVMTGPSQSEAPLNLSHTSFTIGFWIKLASHKTGAIQAFWLLDKQLGAGSTSATGWNVMIASDAMNDWRLTLGLSGKLYSAAISRPFPNFSDGTWHHVGINFVYNPGSTSVSFWMDGTKTVPETYTDGFAAGANVSNNTAPLWVGQRNLTNPHFGSPFDGTIDDLFIATSLYGFIPVGGAPPNPSPGGSP